MKGCGGDERGRSERERGREGGREGSENTEEERESEPVCLCVRLCTSVCWRKDFKEPAEQRLLRFFTSSFFFFFPTKAPLALDPPPLLSDYSSVSPQRQQPGLLDSVGHR